MADRSLVRARPLVNSGLPSGVLLILLLVSRAAPGAEPIERKPYAIRAWLALAPEVRLDADGRADLIASWRRLVRNHVGAPWNLEIVEADGRLAIAGPEELTAGDFQPRSAGLDVLWAVRVELSSDGTLRAAGRAYDPQTATLGPLCLLSSPHPADLPRTLFRLGLALFVPSGAIGPASGGGVSITVQGADLNPADPIAQVVRPGAIFTPYRILLNADGSTKQVVPIGWTYLKVESVDGPVARCAIVSGLRDPLSRRVIGKYRLVALGVKPGDVPLRLRFLTRPPNPQPAAGYALTVRDAPDGLPREVGTTDREGRIAVPPGTASGLVILRLLAGGIEPLVEFPALPGASDEELTIHVGLLPQAVAVETKLNALRDEVADLVAIRSRISHRLEARVDGNAWDEVKELLDEFHHLKPRQAFLDRLEQIKAEAQKQQDTLKVPVLTRTAQALLTDTESLILRYLDDDVFQAYENAYRDAQSGKIVPPSADWKPFEPRGGGCQVLMPGTPRRTTLNVPGSPAGLLPGELWVSDFQGATYGIGVTDPSGAGKPASLPTAPEQARAALVAAKPGSRLLESRDVKAEGRAGADFTLAREAAGEIVERYRAWTMPGGRLALLSYTGPKSKVTAKEAESFFNSFRATTPSQK